MYVNNGVKAKKNFERYQNQIVINWTGAFLKFTENTSHLEHYNDLYFLFIKMNPTDSTGEYPDITLAVHKKVFNVLKYKMAALKLGQLIQFNATIDHLGDEWSFHFFHLIDFALLDEYVDPLKIAQFDMK